VLSATAGVEIAADDTDLEIGFSFPFVASVGKDFSFSPRRTLRTRGKSGKETF